MKKEVRPKEALEQTARMENESTDVELHGVDASSESRRASLSAGKEFGAVVGDPSIQLAIFGPTWLPLRTSTH